MSEEKSLDHAPSELLCQYETLRQIFLTLFLRSSLTPSRKRSSEERRIAVAPSLLTIPDVNALPLGLTESSSSGQYQFLFSLDE